MQVTERSVCSLNSLLLYLEREFIVDRKHGLNKNKINIENDVGNSSWTIIRCLGYSLEVENVVVYQMVFNLRNSIYCYIMLIELRDQSFQLFSAKRTLIYHWIF